MALAQTPVSIPWPSIPFGGVTLKTVTALSCIGQRLRAASGEQLGITSALRLAGRVPGPGADVGVIVSRVCEKSCPWGCAPAPPRPPPLAPRVAARTQLWSTGPWWGGGLSAAVAVGLCPMAACKEPERESRDTWAPTLLPGGESHVHVQRPPHPKRPPGQDLSGTRAKPPRGPQAPWCLLPAAASEFPSSEGKPRGTLRGTR